MKIPYKEMGNVYSVAEEVNRKKRAKRHKMFLWMLGIAGTAALTAVMHIAATFERGYEGIGGEFLIPFIPLIIFLVYKGMQGDKKHREERRKYIIEKYGWENDGNDTGKRRTGQEQDHRYSDQAV